MTESRPAQTTRPTPPIRVVRSSWDVTAVLSWLRQNLAGSARRHVSAVRKRREWREVDLRPSLAEARIVAITVVKNEGGRLDHHLDYYRRLGVEHFLLVDNESDDRTLDQLRDEEDVSTFQAFGSFAGARYATDWVNGILHRHCRGKWVLWLDADESLLFSPDPATTLQDLVARLEAERLSSLQTIMLDMYSSRPPSQNVLRRGQDPLEVCALFDRTGYRQRLSRDNHTGWIKGGVRARLFFDDPEDGPALNKTPLVRWRRHHVFMKVAHQLWPGHLNGGSRLGGALLHFKFTDVAAQKIVDPATRAEHTAEYDAYDDLDAVRFVGPETETFEDAAQLQRLGLITPHV